MNKINPNIRQRKSIRLKGYDYSQAGLYFITIVVQNHACLFGEIVDGEMALNDAGKMVENEWLKLPKRFTNIQLHEYILMPNHFHTILKTVGGTVGATVGATLVVAQNDVILQNTLGASQKRATTNRATTRVAPTGKTVGDMIGAFKSITTVEYIRGVKTNNWQRFDGKLWQRNYWEHIVRNENEYQHIAQYITDNPKKWDMDKLNGGDENKVMEITAEYNHKAWMV